MSHDFYKNQAQEFWDTLEQLRETHNVKAWSAGTAGMHIHISRTGFSSGAHMHRFLNLVYSNQPFYETLAGRESERWAKFTDVLHTKSIWSDDEGSWLRGKTTRSFIDKINDGRNSDRYSAVNMQNRETLEMRIFRSSVKSDTVKAQLDLAHASVEYTRSLSVKQVIDGALTQSAFIQYISENESLYPQLIARIIKCNIQLTNYAV
jgi:L-rhamnose mutarotase